MAQRISIFIEFELVGDIAEFEGIFREIVSTSHQAGGDLTYDFYRDPEAPNVIFALESHPDPQALEAHFRRSFPLLQKAWACARPVKTVVLGDLPAPLKAELEKGGVIAVPWWMGDA